jgi:hypothetical protein
VVNLKQINYVGDKKEVNVNKINIKQMTARCPDSKGCAK